MTLMHSKLQSAVKYLMKETIKQQTTNKTKPKLGIQI